jgi:hypothetical protein
MFDYRIARVSRRDAFCTNFSETLWNEPEQTYLNPRIIFKNNANKKAAGNRNRIAVNGDENEPQEWQDPALRLGPDDKKYIRPTKSDQVPVDHRYIAINYGTRAAQVEDIVRSYQSKSKTGQFKYPDLKGLAAVPSLVECCLASLAYSLDWLDLGIKYSLTILQA